MFCLFFPHVEALTIDSSAKKLNSVTVTDVTSRLKSK